MQLVLILVLVARLAALAEAGSSANRASDACDDHFPVYARLSQGSSIVWRPGNYEYRAINMAVTLRMRSSVVSTAGAGSATVPTTVCPGVFAYTFPTLNFNVTADIVWFSGDQWGTRWRFSRTMQANGGDPTLLNSWITKSVGGAAVGSGDWTRLEFTDPCRIGSTLNDIQFPVQQSGDIQYALAQWEDQTFSNGGLGQIDHSDPELYLTVNATGCVLDVFAMDVLMSRDTVLDRVAYSNRVHFDGQSTAPRFYTSDSDFIGRVSPRANPDMNPAIIYGGYQLIGYDPRANASHCGSCSNACITGHACVRGVCATNLDQCAVLQPCLNGGTCTSGVESYTCQCTSAYLGVNCSIPVAPVCAEGRHTGFLRVTAASTGSSVTHTFPSAITPSMLPAPPAAGLLGDMGAGGYGNVVDGFKQTYSLILWVRALEGPRETTTPLITIHGDPEIAVSLLPGDYWHVAISTSPTMHATDYIPWPRYVSRNHKYLAPTDRYGTWRPIHIGVHVGWFESGRQVTYDEMVDSSGIRPFFFGDGYETAALGFKNITGWTLHGGDHSFQVSNIALFAGEPDYECEYKLGDDSNMADWGDDPCTGAPSYLLHDKEGVLNDSLPISGLVAYSQQGNYDNCYNCGQTLTQLLSWVRFDPTTYPNYADKILGNTVAINGAGFAPGGYDLYNDPLNCGACGRSTSSCTAPNDITTCINGAFVCNFNACASSPCQHGGSCTASPDGTYTCACPAGYSGRRCQTDVNDCASTPCRHGGTCTDLVNGFTCSCEDGYTGPDCTTNIDECASSPCDPRAFCNDMINGYSCSCVPCNDT